MLGDPGKAHCSLCTARRRSINRPRKYHQSVPTAAQEPTAYGKFFSETNIAPSEIAEKGKSPKKINAKGHREGPSSSGCD
jgi:hypothetical protein